MTPLTFLNFALSFCILTFAFSLSPGLPRFARNDNGKVGTHRQDGLSTIERTSACPLFWAYDLPGCHSFGIDFLDVVD